MTKPYFQDGSVTIYHGDCREILPTLIADVLITDPPYGIDLGANAGSGGKHGLSHSGYASFCDSYENFVDQVVPALNMALDMVRRGAVFTGPHIHEQRKPDAIGGIYCPSASGRHCWGFKTLLPVLLYGKAPGLEKGGKGTVLASTEIAQPSLHPVPKPIGWMSWVIGLASLPGETVLDSFMGSGTTLRAAKDLGRKAIGIEIEERYCEIAAKRMAQQVLAL